MALNMRALYYIVLPHGPSKGSDERQYEENVKANENCLNQNFTILAQKLSELEERLSFLEKAE